MKELGFWATLMRLCGTIGKFLTKSTYTLFNYGIPGDALYVALAIIAWYICYKNKTNRMGAALAVIILFARFLLPHILNWFAATASDPFKMG